MGKKQTIGTVPGGAVLLKSFPKHDLYLMPHSKIGGGEWIDLKLVRSEMLKRRTKSNWKLGWNGERLSYGGCAGVLMEKRPKVYEMVVTFLLTLPHHHSAAIGGAFHDPAMLESLNDPSV